MLSLRELRRTVRILDQVLSGTVLRRAAQPDAHQLILSFEGQKTKLSVLLSCDSVCARICSAENRTQSAKMSSSFYEYVRAHLIGAVLSKVEVPIRDRQVLFHLRSRSNCWVLLFSILGARSNLYLLGPDRKLVHAMRPLDETRRELKLGELWTDPDSESPSEGKDRWEEVPDALYLDMVADAYQQLELKRKAELTGRRIAQAVRREKAFLERKLINLQEDLGRAEQAEIYRQRGELLKSVLHTVVHGADRIMATDCQTGRLVEIPLDPKLSPAANLQSYFARYQKESRGAEAIRRQLEDVALSQKELNGIEQKVEQALKVEPPDIETLENISLQPVIRRLIARCCSKQNQGNAQTKSSAEKEIPSRLQPKRYKTEDGLEIWVGRNDEGNDYLTMRLARGNDLFFHLEGFPGSHVVLRTQGRSDPPARSVLDACELAAHYSKLKDAARADVRVAPIKDVKKPKGAKPGFVYVRKGKVIHLRRDLKRLRNILASRIDE